MYPKELADERGFSLAELLVGMFVAMLLIGGATTAFIIQNRASSVQQGTSDVQLSGQVTMEFLERDIRIAGYHVNKSTALATAYTPPPGRYAPVRAAGTGAIFVNYNITANVSYFYYIEPPNTEGREGGLTRLDTLTDQVETIASNVENMRVTGIPYVPTAAPVSVSLLLRSPYSEEKFDSPNTVENFAVDVARYPHCRRKAYTSLVRPRNYGM